MPNGGASGGGGNAHQRAMERAKRKFAEEIVTQVVARIFPIPLPRAENRNTRIKRAKEVISGTIGIISAVVGAIDVFPLSISLIFYAVGLVAILWALWDALVWKVHWKLALLVVVSIVYCSFLSVPVIKQYQRENEIAIAFKRSPELGWMRRQIMMHDLAQFKQYLSSLGLYIPNTVPPITVTHGVEVLGTPPQLPVYRGELAIPDTEIKNRSEITSIYADYVIEKNVERSKLAYTRDLYPTLMFGIMETSGIKNYLDSSYWEKLDKRASPFAAILWDVRKKLGKDYTDQLAVDTLRVICDSPEETTKDVNVGADFWRKVKIADSVVESDSTNWPQIVAILKAHGQDVSKL